MTGATTGQKCLVIVGATGMVGGYALGYALEQPTVQHVIAIGRRKLGISHPKLEEVLHQNFTDVPHLQRRSQARMQRSFVWVLTPERCRTRNSGG